MKQILISILVLITLQNYAQTFAPIGATWHYSQRTINPDVTSFKTIESISDTMIDGILCKKMIEVERFYYDTISIAYHYMYSEDDSVFFRYQDNFNLLYDFGAITGDTITLGFSTHNGTPLKMIIDSTSTIMVNSEERKIQYITCGDGIVIEFGKHVIEGIGNTWFMFPTLDGQPNGPLRCYQDSTIGLFISPYHHHYGWGSVTDCEEIITSSDEIKRPEQIHVYPNPTKGKVSITNIERETAFQIFNIQGRIMLHGIIESSNEINIHSLSNGIYLIRLENKETTVIRRIIKK